MAVPVAGDAQVAPDHQRLPDRRVTAHAEQRGHCGLGGSLCTLGPQADSSQCSERQRPARDPDVYWRRRPACSCGLDGPAVVRGTDLRPHPPASRLRELLAVTERSARKPRRRRALAAVGAACSDCMIELAEVDDGIGVGIARTATKPGRLQPAVPGRAMRLVLLARVRRCTCGSISWAAGGVRPLASTDPPPRPARRCPRRGRRRPASAARARPDSVDVVLPRRARRGSARASAWSSASSS